jgi:ferric-dicitrate binding protein FerR (iron transport regulator)
MDNYRNKDLSEEEKIKLKQLRALMGINRRLEPAEKQKAYQAISRKVGLNKRVLFPWKQILQYAAVIAITFGMSWFVFTESPSKQPTKQWVKVTAPFGQMAEVSLPDGTVVKLNSDSELSYPINFDESERQVKLLGEGYFSVSTNPERPFVVATSAYDVKVTGTEFNVSAYKDQFVRTVLVEGKVSILREGEEHKMLPGEMFTYYRNSGQLEKRKTDTGLFTDWQDGVLQLRGATLDQLAAHMRRWYNVEVKFDSEASKNLRINGTLLQNKPIDQVLAIFKLTGQLDYAIQNNHKQKTIITLKNIEMK